MIGESAIGSLCFGGTVEHQPNDYSPLTTQGQVERCKKNLEVNLIKKFKEEIYQKSLVANNVAGVVFNFTIDIESDCDRKVLSHTYSHGETFFESLPNPWQPQAVLRY